MKELLKAIKQHNKKNQEDEEYAGGLWDYCGEIALTLMSNELIAETHGEAAQDIIYQIMTS